MFGAFRRLTSKYGDLSKAAPWSLAFATCWVKGAASDITSQTVIEGRSLSIANFSMTDKAMVGNQGDDAQVVQPVNLRRMCAFATFSGAYLGCGQHFFYNVVFLKLFGEGTTRAAISKVAADSAVHVPMIYLPLYYMFENTALGGSPEKGLKQYSEEWWDTCFAYWRMWPAFHFINFRFNRPELRIATIAVFSYLWLIVLSFLSHKRLDHAPPDQGSASVDAK